MARYIDVDKFLKSMITKFKCVPLLGVPKYINGEECFEGEHLNSLINEIPTADVVEVVRCKDCIHRDPEDKKCDCSFQAMGGILPMDDDDFCSYGEKVKI